MGARTRLRTMCSCIRPATSRSIAKVLPLGSRVPQRAFERLELHEGKLTRAVPWGLGSSNAPRLPAGGGGNAASLLDRHRLATSYLLRCVSSPHHELGGDPLSLARLRGQGR